jgi:hypothetical protein
MQHRVDPNHLYSSDNMTISKSRLWMLIGFFMFIALLGLGAAGYAFYRASSVTGELSTLREARMQTKDQLVEEISKLIILPEGEEPTIATVVDPKTLQDQPFFKNAKAGDRVLIYSKDSRAVLYDPVAKRVVEIGYLNVETGGNKLSTGVGQ